jgi:type I restriction enzyme S subunit
MELKPGYKQSEVGVIPEDWSASTVGEEFHIQLGKMLDAEKNVGISKPFLGNRAVQWGRIDVTDIGLIKLAPSDLQRFRLRDGDLLVCEGGEVGRSAIWCQSLDECYYQKALHRLRPKKGFNVPFMQNILHKYSVEGLLQNYVTQTSIAHLPKDKFETLPVPVPPPVEQQAIAEALSNADALIESIDQLLTKKRQIKQGAMQELLTGQRRLPGFSGEWEKKSVGDVADVKTGPFGSSLHESDYVQSGTPIITVEHLGEFGVTHQNLPLVSDEDRERLGAYSLKAGDIVFSRVGSVDRNALIREEQEGWLFSGRLLRVRPIHRIVHSPYLSFQFHTWQFKNAVLKVAVGQTMASLNTQILKALYVDVPDIAEQTAIATVLSEMDDDIVNFETQLQKARHLKQGMMQELLTGRIRLV